MGTQVELQSKLEELLGSKNVYYQPPENLKIQYPAIIYSKNRTDTTRAGDSLYRKNTSYSITVVNGRPDHPVIDKLLEMPYCSYDRPYKSNNLYHDVLTLYY